MERALGGGTFDLAWESIHGEPGLAPRLRIEGVLHSRDYSPGSAVVLAAEVTACELATGGPSILGTTPPRALPLRQLETVRWGANPPPPRSMEQRVYLHLPMPPFILEGLEARRLGGPFDLKIDTAVLLIDRREVPEEANRADLFDPTWRHQQDLRLSSDQWATVLEQWGRGVGITVLVPLPALEPNEERARVVRELSDARQRIDGGDYTGSVGSSRRALETLRALLARLLPPGTPPARPQERDVPQRIETVLVALFNLASAASHTNEPIGDWEPARADAVALAGATASLAQEVFALLDA